MWPTSFAFPYAKDEARAGKAAAAVEEEEEEELCWCYNGAFRVCREEELILGGHTLTVNWIVTAKNEIYYQQFNSESQLLLSPPQPVFDDGERWQGAHWLCWFFKYGNNNRNRTRMSQCRVTLNTYLGAHFISTNGCVGEVRAREKEWIEEVVEKICK